MARKKPIALDDLLALVPTDTREIPTPPETDGLPPLAAKKALASYYRRLADAAISREDERRARTRAMIILGARISTITDPAIRDAIRAHMAATDRPGDFLAVCEVVPWMAAAAITPDQLPAVLADEPKTDDQEDEPPPVAEIVDMQ